MSDYRDYFLGPICRIALLIVAAFCVFAPSARAQLPTAVGWTVLPASTSLQGSDACPPNNFGGDPFLFSEYCENVIRAWSGAIADTTANRLIIWGGGHNNYYGNEIYSLNLTANPVTLVRLKDPTVPTNFENSSNCIDGIPPGSANFAPNSRESYAGMAFLPTAYRMYIEGGSVACLLGDQSQNTWTIPLSGLSSSTSWVHENPTISGPTPGSDGGFTYGNIADYDPNSGLIFLSDSAAIYTYNYSTNTYTMISPSQGFVTSIYLSGTIDPTRKLFVLVGGSCGNGSCGPGDGVFVADISDPTSTTQQNWTTNTLANPTCAEFLAGGVNPINTSNPGIAFDSVANDFVAWPNQGNSIYILTPDVANQRLTCTKQTFANGPPNSAHHSDEPNTSYGTFGRLRYFPALDAFVLINDWNIPAYILRLRGTAPKPDFSLSATPGSNSVVQGKSASYTVSVGAIGTFSGAVGLSVSGLPTGATASFSPQSVSTSGNSTLSVSTAASTPTGSYTLTVAGASGSISHTATVSLVVTAAPPPANFTLTAGPSSDSVVQGKSATYTATVAAQNGFTGNVALRVAGVPSGATATFSAASISTSGSSTLSVVTTSSTAAGSYTLTITGKNGSLSHTASVTLVVTSAPPPANFALTAGPSSDSVVQGSKATYTATVTGQNGFTGSVALSVTGAPAGATATFSPASISTSGSSTLMVSTTASTAAGSYTLTITGTSGSISQHASVGLTVTAAGGSSGGGVISVKFVGSGVAMAASEVAGVVPEGNWNQANGASSSSAMPLMDENGSTTGATITWAGDNGYNLPIADQPGNVRMMRGYLDNDKGDTTVVTVSGLPAVSDGYKVYVYADGSNGANSRTGIYQISGAEITTTSISLTDLANTNFDGSFTRANNSAGNYVVLSVNATAFTLSAIPSTASSSAERAPLNGIQIVANGQSQPPSPNFSLSASPSSATVTQGGKAVYTAAVTAQNGFTGSVTLSASGLPVGASASFSSASISGSGSSTMTITTAALTPAGGTTFTITGSSGTLTHSANAILVVTAAGSGGAKAISVKFVGTGTAMAGSEIAGVVAEDNWNQAAGASSSSPMSLVDETGATTSATIGWTADNIYNLPIADEPGNARMMRGYLDNSKGNPTVITVSGLPANTNGYAVYVYADGNNGADSRAAQYAISGAGITSTTIGLADLANTDFDGTFTQANNTAGNYVMFTITSAAGGFTLTATPNLSQSGVERAPVNGIQIVPR